MSILSFLIGPSAAVRDANNAVAKSSVLITEATEVQKDAAEQIMRMQQQLDEVFTAMRQAAETGEPVMLGHYMGEECYVCVNRRGKVNYDG